MSNILSRSGIAIKQKGSTMKSILSSGILLLICTTAVLAASDQHNINGTWVGTAPDGSIIKYTFTKDRGVIWKVSEKSFSKMFPNGLRGKYTISVKKPIATIDISAFKHPVFKEITFLGIFQLIDAKTMRLQGLPNTAGPRLTRFNNQAILFKRVK